MLASWAVAVSGPQLGTSWGGEETLRFVNSQEGIDETHSFRRWFTVISEDERMWVVDSRKRLISTKIDGNDVPAPPGTEPASAKEWLSPAGFLLDLQPFDNGDFRLERLLHFWLPGNIPDDWTVELKTTSSETISKGKAVFHSTSWRGSTAREYELQFSEPQLHNGLTATGKLRFDTGSGRLLSANIEVEGGVMPGGTDRAHITVTYVDSKTTKPLDK